MDPAVRRQTLADLLHRSAKRYPGKTAIECGDPSGKLLKRELRLRHQAHFGGA